jgi:Flp pilus assembly protein TadG
MRNSRDGLQYSHEASARGWMRSVPSGDSGGSLVELAVTLPIFLMMLLGASVYALLWYDSIEVSSAARAGVQYGMQNPATALDKSGMQTVALKNGSNVSGMTAVAINFCQCESNLGDSSKNVPCATTTCTAPQTVPIQFVQVTTSATVIPMVKGSWLPGVPFTIPSSFALTGKAVMRVQE